jgi:hypothetical protein
MRTQGGEDPRRLFRSCASRARRSRRVDLGGGPERDVPEYALDLGKAPTGPASDDEDVPQGSEFFDSGSNQSAPLS